MLCNRSTNPKALLLICLNFKCSSMIMHPMISIPSLPLSHQEGHTLQPECQGLSMIGYSLNPLSILCIHLMHSSGSLKLPEELLNKNSAAWNKGRVHYASAPDEVAQAYTDQFAKDITTFLDCRAKELVVGGLMVLIMPGIPNGIHRSSAPTGMIFDFLGLCLIDMAKEVSQQSIISLYFFLH